MFIVHELHDMQCMMIFEEEIEREEDIWNSAEMWTNDKIKELLFIVF